MGDHQQLDPEIAAHYAAVRAATAGALEPGAGPDLGAARPPPATSTRGRPGHRRAAGVYALPLAARGYQIHLVDPMALHVRQALRASAEQPATPLARATVGDARQLDHPAASVDATLLLGPLYHLIDRADRIRTLTPARHRPPLVALQQPRLLHAA